MSKDLANLIIEYSKERCDPVSCKDGAALIKYHTAELQHIKNIYKLKRRVWVTNFKIS